MDGKRERVVERIAELIRTPGALSGGRLPPERVLAARLGISRNLLREAIVAMETMGALEIRERRGTFAAEPKASDLAGSLRYLPSWADDLLVHLMETRLIIETPAAALAAERRTEDQLRRMRACLERLECVRNDPDRGLASGAGWDSALHATIVEAARNPVLARLYEGLAFTMERDIAASRARFLAVGAWPGTLLEEHRSIVEAIACGAASRAEEAMRVHLRGALAALKHGGGER